MFDLKFAKIRQKFPRPVVHDIPGEVRKELEGSGLAGRIKPGQRIAITAGSRGIKDITTILRSVVEVVRHCGGDPFIVGAMGSHGGGTIDGQRSVLAHLGITESSMGCPVLVSDQVVQIGETPSGLKVYCDINAYRADGIIVCNRIKPHTSFHGANESGLCKMMAVGLGKAPGASVVHHQGTEVMAQTIVDMTQVFLQTGKVVAGLAIVENGYEETAIIRACTPEELVRVERGLLEKARSYLPKLPVEKLDLLVVREMGKNFSGTGMDTNVIGRVRIIGAPEPSSPFIARIVVLDLSEKARGNATGIGLADVTTRRLVDKIDFDAMYLNCITTGNLQRAMLPVIMPTDEKAIEAALRSLALTDPASLRGAIINNTLELEYLWVTTSLLDDLTRREDIEAVKTGEALAFRDGRLVLPPEI